ncbi:MAG: DUF3667 domain-containing protein [Pedobacter sp.]|nr:MAG: DUF3667 domain-containing protein [Pedobacter sp.]
MQITSNADTFVLFSFENRFCSNCGQENVETRKTFHHLFVHFFEDLTHYENSFWKTIINLFGKPSQLTKEYLSGKRMSYLAPVRLYIFISFVTFFILSLTPSKIDSEDFTVHEAQPSAPKNNSKNIPANDSLTFELGKTPLQDSIIKVPQLKKTQTPYELFRSRSIKELDSIQKYGKEDDRVPDYFYSVVRKSILVTQKFTPNEILQKLTESLQKNFPKVLIIYMPLFAFFLWLFHGKKRWYYFDHGIFTLHYFSFLLLIALVLSLLSELFALGEEYFLISLLDTIIKIVGYGWMIYYFFLAHYRFYGEGWMISLIKSSILFFINFVFTSIILITFFIYSFINLH